jgi:hypothetical protein
MKNFIRRGLCLVLALMMLTSPMLTLTAEAKNGKSRGKGSKSRGASVYAQKRGRGQQERVQSSRRSHDDNHDYDRSRSRQGSHVTAGRRSGYDNRNDSSNNHSRHQSRSRQSRSSGSRRHGSREGNDSAIVPFLGGLVLGAILGNASASSRSERHYVYDCDPCGGHYGSYDRWSSHLVEVHEVPSCDVAEYYPEHQGGHWESY